MKMQLVIQSSLLLVILACVRGDEYNWLQQTVDCKGSKESCYQTGQCCEGLVCVAYPETYGYIPEYPGLCIKEKDEHFCQDDKDCPDYRECAKVGSLGGRPINMCVEKTESKRWYHLSRPHSSYNPRPSVLLSNNENYTPPKFRPIVQKNKPLRLGSLCLETPDGCPKGMCCQLRRSFRSRPSYKCHPIEGNSLCKNKGYAAKEVDDFRK